MKLYLSSLASTPSQAQALAELAGKDIHAVRIGLIENAADVYEEKDRAWVIENREALQEHGFDVELIDIRKFKMDLEALHTNLLDKDVIWLGGGNSFCLRWILRDTSADNIIRELVNDGRVYAGGSAGAIVAGPTLHHFETADDPSVSPGVIYEGLNFTDKVVVPHYDNEKFSNTVRAIDDKLKKSGYQTMPLKDTQAFIVSDNKEVVV